MTITINTLQDLADYLSECIVTPSDAVQGEEFTFGVPVTDELEISSNLIYVNQEKNANLLIKALLDDVELTTYYNIYEYTGTSEIMVIKMGDTPGQVSWNQLLWTETATKNGTNDIKFQLILQETENEYGAQPEIKDTITLEPSDNNTDAPNTPNEEENITNEPITIPIPETITNQRNYGKKQNIYTLTPKITRRNRENKTPTILANNGIQEITVTPQEAEDEATQNKAEITLVFDAINNPTLELTNDSTSDAENITEIIQNNPQVFNNKFQSDGTPDIAEYMILVQAIYNYIYDYIEADSEILANFTNTDAEPED